MVTQLAWLGDGAPRMEVARVFGTRPLVASGTQLGRTYELRYHLAEDTLQLQLNGAASVEFTLEGADFFDLGWSPLFNSLPVLRDSLLDPAPAQTYVIRWIDVPSLAVSRSEQRYEPLGGGIIRFSAGEFSSEISFDADGFVLDYPGIASRL